MAIKFHCKNCSNEYEVDDALAGESFKCEACAADMQIPFKTTDLDSEPGGDMASAASRESHTEFPTDTTATVKVFSVTGATQRSDDIEFECKICGQKYRLSKEFAGHEAECAKCKRVLIIPKYSDVSEGTSSVKITFWCKKCGQKYRLSQSYARHQAHCVKCKGTFIVPINSESGPTGEDINEPSGTGAGRPSAPPEKVEWLPSPVSKYQTEKIPEKKPTPQKTRAQVVQDALTSRNLQTQTSVEITGNPASMVRYVLAPPNRKLRKFIGVAIIFLCMAAVAFIVVKLCIPAKKPETRLVNTMCLDCKFIEARTISNINTARCSKCNSDVGYAWKCYKCGKVFSREVSKDNGDVLLVEKIRPPECPICNSDNVKYINPETVPGVVSTTKSSIKKH